MDKKRYLKTAVRYVLQGGQLDSNALSWPALKQRLLDDDFLSADELEEERNYIIRLYLDGIKESLQGQLLDTGDNDSGFHGSLDVNAVDSDSDSDSVQVSLSANETRVPIVDATRNDETSLFNVFVSESWQGAGLKYGKGEDSYIRARWAEMHGLIIDGSVMLRWKFDHKSQTKQTVFIPSPDLETLDCDFLLGTKHQPELKYKDSNTSVLDFASPKQSGILDESSNNSGRTTSAFDLRKHSSSTRRLGSETIPSAFKSQSINPSSRGDSLMPRPEPIQQKHSWQDDDSFEGLSQLPYIPSGAESNPVLEEDALKDYESSSSNSDAHSITSITDSIFTVASASTMFSEPIQTISIQYLIQFLLEDSNLFRLFKEGCTRIQAIRFERNLRKLLWQLAVNLRKEAKSEEQKGAARFVRHYARNAAHIICNRVGEPKNAANENDSSIALKNRHISEPSEQQITDVAEGLSDDSNESSDGEDDVFDTQQLQLFIKNSIALEIFRSSLESFIHPSNQNRSKEMGIKNSHEAAPAVEDSPENTHEASSSEQNYKTSPKVVVTSEVESGDSLAFTATELILKPNSKPSLPSEHSLDEALCALESIQPEYSGSNTALSHALTESQENHNTSISQIESNGAEKIFGKTTYLNYLNYVMRMLVGLCKWPWIEPIISPGTRRIRWKCSCGQLLYDDFTELQEGSIDRMQQLLNNAYSDSTPGNNQGSLRSVSAILSATIKIIQRIAGYRKNTGLPQYELQTPPTSQPPQDPSTTPPPDLLYLLLCHSQGIYATKLLQLDVSHFGSDKSLFVDLNKRYRALRSKVQWLISFRTVTRIKFVKFELFEKELVDVKKPDGVLPPEDLDYRYQPKPKEVEPPIGENHLMHLFMCPTHAGDKSICLDRFPKKLREQLKVCDNTGIGVGWGLQLEEGWDQKRVWKIAFVIFVLGSALWAILWTVFEHSIQDAFAVSGYMVSVAVVSVGFTQAMVESSS